MLLLGRYGKCTLYNTVTGVWTANLAKFIWKVQRHFMRPFQGIIMIKIWAQKGYSGEKCDIELDPVKCDCSEAELQSHFHCATDYRLYSSKCAILQLHCGINEENRPQAVDYADCSNYQSVPKLTEIPPIVTVKTTPQSYGRHCKIFIVEIFNSFKECKLYDILQNILFKKILATPFWSTTTTIITTTTKIVTTISSTTAEDVYVTEPYEPSGDFEGSAWESNDDEDFSNNEYGTVQEETIIYHDMSTYDVKLYLRDQPESNQTDNFIKYLRIQFPQIRSVCIFLSEKMV